MHCLSAQIACCQCQSSLISGALAPPLALPVPVTRLAAAVIHALPNNDSSHLRKSGICSIGLDTPLPYIEPTQISDSIVSTLPSAGGVELPPYHTLGNALPPSPLRYLPWLTSHQAPSNPNRAGVVDVGKTSCSINVGNQSKRN